MEAIVPNNTAEAERRIRSWYNRNYAFQLPTHKTIALVSINRSALAAGMPDWKSK